MVSLDIEHSDLEKRMELWDKLISLKSILKEEYISEVLFNDSLILDNNKDISRVYIEKLHVSIHNKDTWKETMEFLYLNMSLLEDFFENYREILDS